MSQENRKSKKLLKGVWIYAAGTFGSKLLVLLIVPLYTYYISTSDMGDYDLLMTTINLLTPVITMQISDAAYRWMIRTDNNRQVYVRATLQVLTVNCLAAAFCIFCVNKIHPFRFWAEFIVVLITGRALQTIQKLLRGLKDQKLFAVSGIIYTVIFLALNVIQICVLGYGVRSLFTSSAIANIVAIIFVLASEQELRVPFFKKPDFPLLREMFTFSLPLVPNQLNWWVLNASDRYVIRFFMDSSANGVYSIAYKFPTALQMILNLFNTSWQDVAIADTDTETGSYYSRIFRELYTFSFTLLWALVPATKLFINIFMDPSYRTASDYISFLYLGTIFQSFSSFYGVGYLREKSTVHAATTSIFGAVINIAVNVALIRYIGLYASAFSTFCGFFVMWTARAFQNRHSLKIRIRMRTFCFYFLITFAVCLAACFSSFRADLIMTGIGMVIFVYLNRTIIRTMMRSLQSR